MTETYSKPFKTIPEQVDLLRDRGMSIPDAEEAARVLESVGYYRLSGYWYPYRVRRPIPTSDPKVMSGVEVADEFEAGTSLDTVVAVYEFDRKLRLLVLDAIERIEVVMRVRLGHVLGAGHPFAHRDSLALNSGFTRVEDPDDALSRANWLISDHATWLGNVRRLEDQSKEEFVKHFKRKYSSPLPAWVVTEILTFGGLSTLYQGMKQRHQNQIAESFCIFDGGLDGDGVALVSWMTNLNYLRNTCAHHARLWNKNMTVQISKLNEVPDLHHASQSTSRVYASLATLAYLVAKVSPRSSWRVEIAGHIKSGLAAVGQDESKMGCPPNWEKEPLWSASYVSPADPVPAKHRALKQKFETVSASDVGIVVAPTLESSRRTSIVRRLRGSSELLGLQIGQLYNYPVFQLDTASHQVKPVVKYANQKLDARNNPWDVASWWTTPMDALDGQTPLERLESGNLTETDVDNTM